jgi:hypothetical protein
MPRYFFSLRNGDGEIREGEGQDLDDTEVAIGHAKDVAQELMKNRELQTRHWQLHVQAETGEVLARLCFAQIDPTLDHLGPEWRQAVVDISNKCLALCEVTSALRNTVRQSRALLARSRGQPYLITHQWGQFTDHT